MNRRDLDSFHDGERVLIYGEFSFRVNDVRIECPARILFEKSNCFKKLKTISIKFQTETDKHNAIQFSEDSIGVFMPFNSELFSKDLYILFNKQEMTSLSVETIRYYAE